MDIQYRRNMKNNYVVIKNSNMYLNDYRLNMILKNQIAGLLDTCVSCVNGEAELSYTISSRQCVKDLYEKKKMVYEEILNILSSTVEVCNTIQSYLLKPEDILFDTELVYVDYNSNCVGYCYYPNSKKEAAQEIRNFIQELMVMTDHTDRNAVELIYGVFDICNKDDFLISDIDECIKKIAIREKDVDKSVEGAYDYKAENTEYSMLDKVCESDNNGYKVNIYEQDMGSVLKDNILFKKITNVFGGREKKDNNGKENTKFNKCGGSNVEPIKQRWKMQYDNNAIDNIITGEKLTESRKTNNRIADKVTDSKIAYSEIAENKVTENKVTENKITDSRKAEKIMSDDTMYIKDILSGTTRKLLSLTEKNNIDITTYPFIIGKLSSRVDCVIDDKSVSRIHVKISKDEEGDYYIEDMNSKNGTYLNGIQAEPHEKIKVEIGDKIRIATFEYIFR